MRIKHDNGSFTGGLMDFCQGKVNVTLSIVLIIVILGVLGTLGYVITRLNSSDKNTEFYVLGMNGQASDYPTDFTLENGKVVSVNYGGLSPIFPEQWGRLEIGIINHEGQNTNYNITMQIGGIQVGIPFQGGIANNIGPISLKPREKWEQEIGIEPQHTGDNQDVEILLYKNDETEPYLNLNLWINVN